jgi:hypothetical protein
VESIYPHFTIQTSHGRLVVTDCIIRNFYDDALYIEGGNTIVANNIFTRLASRPMTPLT